MAKGFKSGGRAKGVPNKSNQDLIDKANSLGVDPFQVLLLYVKRDWKALGFPSEFYTYEGQPDKDRPIITPEKQIECAKDVCQYLYPKRKAVELSTDQESEGFKIVIQDYSKKDAGT